MTIIYKICPAGLWHEAEQAGIFAGAPVDLADGFVHFSTAAQVRETAAKHFAGQSDLVLVAVSAEGLGPALRFEPSRGGDLFPHLHGPLPTGAALWVRPLPLGRDGAHAFPAGLGEGVPAFDPEAAGWVRRGINEFVSVVGPLWARTEDGETRYGFLAEGRHLNGGGVVHGGMVMTFADQALGEAAWAANGGRQQVTIQLDTHFISGIKEGDFVEARCRVVRHTRSIMFLAGELTVADRIVATASGVWKLRDEPAQPGRTVVSAARP